MFEYGQFKHVQRENPPSLSDVGFLCLVSHQVGWSGISSIHSVVRILGTNNFTTRVGGAWIKWSISCFNFKCINVNTKQRYFSSYEILKGKPRDQSIYD